MSNLKRNHYCGTLAKADNEKEVVLCGWVAKRRDHGGLIFIDLRDRSGIVQVVVDPDHAGEDFAKAEAIRSEYGNAAQFNAAPQSYQTDARLYGQP